MTFRQPGDPGPDTREEDIALCVVCGKPMDLTVTILFTTDGPAHARCEDELHRQVRAEQ